MFKPLALAFFLAILSIATAFSTTSNTIEYFLPPGATYDPSIPTPESFFGFPVGSWHIRHDRLVEYFRLLDRLSDRVTLQEYGTTYEHRPLLLATISHPDNQRRMRELQEHHRAVCNPEKTLPPHAANLPAFVWLGFSVHGNEASGTNASPLVMYYLAAAQGSAIDTLLMHTVILIDPCINPDGYDRFSTWVNGNRGNPPVADPQTREHTEPWPSSRSNHYWFDLNRDYLPLAHVESRARMRMYWEWIPNVLLDFHEMGTQSTYFFQPGKPSAVHPLIPEQNQTLTKEFATTLASGLDSIGSLYFTREVFDDFFIGKGSTYADLAGGVGILFEQASTRGHRQANQDGILEFSFAIRNHVTSALAGLHAAQQHRRALVSYQQTFFRDTGENTTRESGKGYVIASPVDIRELWTAAEFLLKHNIRVHRLAQDYRAGGVTFAADSSLFVPTDQPNIRLLTAMMERRKSFTDSLFYDISSWSLPLAYNLSIVEVRNKSANMAGTLLTESPSAHGSYSGPDTPVAFAFPWSQQSAPRVLYRLLSAGIRARVATQPFSATVLSGREAFRFDRGTIVIPRGVQSVSQDSVERLLRKSSEADGLSYFGLTSGSATEGSDLGSDRFRPLEKPRVLLLAGTSVNAADAGEIWYTLEQRIGMEVSIFELSSLGRLSLERYTTILAPGGSYATTDSTGIANLQSWIMRGGTLVTIEDAAEWASKKGLTSLRVVNPLDRQSDSTARRRPYGEMGNAEGAQLVSGVILEALVDQTHPLVFGYRQERLALSRSTNRILELPKDPYAAPLLYTKELLLSGFLTIENQKALSGTVSAAVSSRGNGRVICFMDNPVFRGYWRGTERLLLNAVFFGKAIRSPGGGRDRPE